MLALVLSLLLVALPPIVRGQGAAPTIDVGYAKIAGFQNTTSGLNQYHGIRYAQNPTGPLRWRKPRAIEAVSTDPNMVINGTQIGPSCHNGVPDWNFPASVVPAGTTYSSEDCLLVDIFTPVNPGSPHLPVLLEIHGGGYTQGSAQSPRPDAMLYRANGTLVWASIQYRLGMFGFLAGNDIKENGDLNAGLLDQRAGIEWVQRHIAAFGGDPDKITITGGSAGGGSVSLQGMANGGADNPPFRAVLSEYPWWQAFVNASTAEKQYRNTMTASACNDINCLRSLSEDQLVTVQQVVMNNSYQQPPYVDGDYYFGPSVDGVFIREHPNTAYKNGRFYKVPFLVDHNEWEGYAFSRQINSSAQIVPDEESFFTGRGPSFFGKLFALYPASDYNSSFWQRIDWFSDVVVDCPTYFMAKAHTDHNYNTSAVWKMRFAAGSEIHGATSPFIYSIDLTRPLANNQTLADIMTWYWISFAIYNDPNVVKHPDAPYWPSYIEGGENGGAGFSTLAVTYTTVSPEEDEQNSWKCDFFNAEGYLSFGGM